MAIERSTHQFNENAIPALVALNVGPDDLSKIQDVANDIFVKVSDENIIETLMESKVVAGLVKAIGALTAAAALSGTYAAPASYMLMVFRLGILVGQDGESELARFIGAENVATLTELDL